MSSAPPNEGAASKTAAMVAAYRARAHERLSNLVCDPYAAQLCGEDGMALATAFDEAFPAMELWMALRTARLDELVEAACTAGASQVVVLGAGFDMRGRRMADRRISARFFEVDTAPSQAEKIARLAAAGLTDDVQRVPCDFEHERPLDVLTSTASFQLEVPTVVLLEGVLPYLTKEAVTDVLTQLATRLDARSTILFDSVARRVVDTSLARTDVARRSAEDAQRIVEGAGEPLYWGVDRHELVPFLFDCGYRSVITESFDELALQHTGTYERERGFKLQVLTQARVDSTSS